MAGGRSGTGLLILFNTGARVQEMMDVRPCDLQLVRASCASPWQGAQGAALSAVAADGEVLRSLLVETGTDPAATEPLFRNQRGRPLTRFEVRYLLRISAIVNTQIAPS